MRVLYGALSCVMFAMVGAGRDTRPPVTKQNVADVAISPDVVWVKRQRKKITEMARQQGFKIAMPPYLEIC